MRCLTNESVPFDNAWHSYTVETLRLKPPEATVVLGQVTFLALDFRCTLPPIVELSGELKFFQPSMWEPSCLPLGKIGTGRPSAPVQVERGNSARQGHIDLLMLVMPV